MPFDKEYELEVGFDEINSCAKIDKSLAHPRDKSSFEWKKQYMTLGTCQSLTRAYKRNAPDVFEEHSQTVFSFINSISGLTYFISVAADPNFVLQPLQEFCKKITLGGRIAVGKCDVSDKANDIEDPLVHSHFLTVQRSILHSGFAEEKYAALPIVDDVQLENIVSSKETDAQFIK
ncbi:uncharacterized protein MONOS_10143 [Monocercomonoides exilis]|uniref:uncharacterized protein n=1 Tax=Monocercomonoides exilis TaxID=2049356 RepID=UPI00355AC68B|nr:hypothetical protein MONOS_10143 [Monocercomonoides exilis]|eukprot:MONOS_10143.1-p1 / transcript=MONOS_10143.1 / gene=MONOS_10143 / organism=Monocercomonoides_exilis_PA203 / gene_product=unspecified product / transcript_product=unspecified product / location=Mono_scaffold00448:38364-38891(+) / protein_length=176 / sequence_SO=supercontig / SO=protein_coding / is_pseudo=false